MHEVKSEHPLMRGVRAPLIFSVTGALLLTPLRHRGMHRIHWDDK
jgi:hypothetical protein